MLIIIIINIFIYEMVKFKNLKFYEEFIIILQKNWKYYILQFTKST